MRSKKCRYCKRTWRQAVGFQFKFPHCEKEIEEIKRKEQTKKLVQDIST